MGTTGPLHFPLYLTLERGDRQLQFLISITSSTAVYGMGNESVVSVRHRVVRISRKQPPGGPINLRLYNRLTMRLLALLLISHSSRHPSSLIPLPSSCQLNTPILLTVHPHKMRSVATRVSANEGHCKVQQQGPPINTHLYGRWSWEGAGGSSVRAALLHLGRPSDREVLDRAEFPSYLPTLSLFTVIGPKSTVRIFPLTVSTANTPP